jgi:hypothetical protein
VGWDGLSFAVLFPLAVGLLAMDEFSKARGTFALTAVALAIKLALSSLKYLRGIWKAAGFLVALLLAASFLVVTNHWVTQRHSVVVSRTPQNIQKEAPKSTSQTDSPTTAPSPSRLLEKDSDNSGEQKKTEKKGTSGRQTQLTGGQKTTKVPPMINAPNGIAIGGGTVLNPTVNNNYAVQDKPGRTVNDADRLRIVTYLSQIKATVSLKAPIW